MGNLPVEVTSFVGRRRELAEGARLLAASRLVTVVGCGGVGKTRLAMRVAAGAYRAFPDGLWFGPLESVPDPALLDETVASALDLRSQSLDPADRLAGYLADRPWVLVLDQCGDP